MTRLNRIAVLMLVVLFCYYEFYRWIPLASWNGQENWPVQNDQFYPDIVIGLLLLLFVFAFVRGKRVLEWTAVSLLGFWVVVHFFDWWLPYLRDSAANYARYSYYASHTQLLPVIGHHYPPDAGHAVLDFLLYPTWIVCLLAAIRYGSVGRGDTVIATV